MRWLKVYPYCNVSRVGNHQTTITDIRLQLLRKNYATHRRYDYVSFENIDEILRLLLWLEDVENAGQPVQDEQLSSEDKFIEGEDTKIENKEVANPKR